MGIGVTGIVIVSGLGVTSIGYAYLDKKLEKAGNETAREDLQTFGLFMVITGVLIAGGFFVDAIHNVGHVFKLW